MKISKYLFLAITIMLLAFSTVVYAETNTIYCGGDRYTFDESGTVIIDGDWVEKEEYDEFLAYVGESYSVTSIELTKEVHGIDNYVFANSQSTLREILIPLATRDIGYNVFGENHNVHVRYAGSEEAWNSFYKDNDNTYFGNITFFAKGGAAINGMWVKGYGNHISGKLFFEFVNRDCVAEFAVYSCDENEELQLNNTYTLPIIANMSEISYEFDFASDGKEHILYVTLYDNMTNKVQWGEIYERTFIAHNTPLVCDRASMVSNHSTLTLYTEFLYVNYDSVLYLEIFDCDEEDNLTFNKSYTIDIPAGTMQGAYDIPFRFDNKLHHVNYYFYDNMTTKNELFDSMTDSFYAYQDFNGFTYDYIDDESVKITCCYSYSGLEGVFVPTKISDYTVTVIGEGAFEDCFAETIIIPDSITKIETGAFAGCTELKQIKYSGDKAAWDSIVIEENNQALTSAKIIYNYHPPISASFSNRYDGKSFNVSIWISDCYMDCLAEIEIFNLSKSESTFVYFEIPAGTYGEKTVALPFPNYEETLILYGALVSTDKTEYYSVSEEFNFFTPYPVMEEQYEDEFFFYINDADEAVILGYTGNDTSLVIPDTLGGHPVTTLSSWSLCDMDYSHLTIGKNLKTISYGALSYCFNLENIAVHPENQYFKFEDGVLYNADKTELVLYLLTNTAEHFTIPESVTVVGPHAFEATENLKTVTVSKNIKRLERQAFAYSNISGELILPEGLEMIGSEALVCNFSKIHIPKTVTQITKDAIAGSFGLTEITVHADNPNYTAVDGVLYNKNKTVLMKYPEAKTDSAFKIPDTVVKINSGSFVGAVDLTELTIPKTVNLICASAFRACYNLSDVYYSGTQSDWDSLLIGLWNDNIQYANMHYSGFTITTISNDGKNFTVNPDSIETGKTVILALYENGKLVEFHNEIYNGDSITFTTNKSYTDAVVMVWNDLTTLIPVCSVEQLQR